jgi:L-fucose isomerase-like protein
MDRWGFTTTTSSLFRPSTLSIYDEVHFGSNDTVATDTSPFSKVVSVLSTAEKKQEVHLAKLKELEELSQVLKEKIAVVRRFLPVAREWKQENEILKVGTQLGWGVSTTDRRKQ